MSSVGSFRVESAEEESAVNDKPVKDPVQPTPQYDRLLKGEITSQEYVQALKAQTVTTRYARRGARQRAGSA